MNGNIRRMLKEIERRGGTIHIDPDTPDEITERFLEEILDCPDCRRAAGGLEPSFDPEAPSIDRVLGIARFPGRYGGH